MITEPSGRKKSGRNGTHCQAAKQLRTRPLSPLMILRTQEEINVTVDESVRFADSSAWPEMEE